MNPDLQRLHPYPFERLGHLLAGVEPPADRAPISMSLGEPKHNAPGFVAEALISHLHTLSSYPPTRGSAALRAAIAAWLRRRFSLPRDGVDPDRHVLPVNGTREALFALAQCVVDRARQPLVLMPNPFYQIYEGAALLAGAEPWFLSATAQNGFLPDFETVPTEIWDRCQLLYLCTPANPTGAALSRSQLQGIIALAERYDFVVASDECYSEIFLDEEQPPPGLLEAATLMGNTDFRRCLAFHSLSKRSSVPGLRSGFVAGDAQILERFLRYRTYHGCAMPPPTQEASIAAWSDEAHAVQNRSLYREKFRIVFDILGDSLSFQRPAGAFYLWPQTPIDDETFVRELYRQQNVSVLPGTFLSRPSPGGNPGHRRVRVALVAPVEECAEAAERIHEFTTGL
jgi:N-succinyldiaminopimelate aminotransferase